EVDAMLQALPADVAADAAADVPAPEPAADPATATTGPIAAPDDWEPPADLDAHIARFNAMQRLVYRTVRAEVGAGAMNFVRACCDEQARQSADPLLGAELQSDGSWSAEGLREAVRRQRIRDPWAEYRQLIELEIERLKMHLGENRVSELQRQVDVAEQSAPAAG
ncbi:MAG TPA: hypothetical protein VJS92_13500, partial [Candidatus Polarisedimenticolaceae bacterium]|nr:hypothetical protein [Candidatus Polarisedimenticolaceae bacterium]